MAYRAVATDADGDTLSYSLSGTDGALFTINPATGEVSFVAAPDFENPGDADGDNVYDIVVTASDGTNSMDQTVAITVTDENEVDNPPIFTSPDSASVAENQSPDTAVYTAMATNADGGDPTYSLSGTADAGEVRFIAAPDFDPTLRADYSLSGTDASLFTIDRDGGGGRGRRAPTYSLSGTEPVHYRPDYGRRPL